MEEMMLELLDLCQEKEFYCVHDSTEDLIGMAMNTMLLSIKLKYQCLDKEKQEVKLFHKVQPSINSELIQRYLVYLDGLEPYLLEVLKRIIISCLLNDVMKVFIKCTTMKAMWNDLILAHEGPSDTRDTKIAALRLKFNAFKALEGEKVNGTFTKLKCLLNDLENKGVSIPQAEVNATDSYIEEDTRSSSEFLADLNDEFHDRVLLANQKRLYKRVTKVKAFMAIAEDEPSVRKANARSVQWVEITMKMVQGLLSMTDSDEKKHVLDYTHVYLHYVDDQRKNLLSKFISLNQELSSRKRKRKDAISPKEVLFTKADESPSKTVPEITFKCECDDQEPLSPLLKILGAEPIGTSI
nr:retrovirus-related Pol polyprotein from transposon TNT 1-94 [Tanacetum cinerariifolium]